MARPTHSLSLTLLDGRYAVCRLDADADLPDWASGKLPLLSLTRTATECSIICPQDRVPADVRAERHWHCLRLEGPFDVDLPGVLVSVTLPIADVGLTCFAISTYDTDYLLVRDLERAADVLVLAGHIITNWPDQP
jgi:uncharacterized protein